MCADRDNYIGHQKKDQASVAKRKDACLPWKQVQECPLGWRKLAIGRGPNALVPAQKTSSRVFRGKAMTQAHFFMKNRRL